MADAAPATPAQQLAADGYDLAGARAAGVSDGEIADYLAPLHGYNLAGARAAGVSDGEIADYLAATPRPPPAPTAPPETSASGAFVRAASEQALPATGGMAAAGMGATTGAALGAAIPIAGETGIPEAIGALGGGLFGFYAGAKAVETAQQAIIGRLPASVQRAIGQAPEQRQADVTQHPYAAMAGGLAPNLLFLRPGAVEQAAENAPAIAKFMASPVASRVFGAGVNTALEAAQEGQSNQGYDPTKLAIAAGAGALMNRETAFGRGVSGVGAAAAARIGSALSPRPGVPRAPTPDAAVAGILAADNVDDSIAAAEELAQRQTPIDVDQVTADLDAGEPADQQQAKLLRMFDSLGSGAVEHDGGGGYQFRTTGPDGAEVTHPIEAWDPDELRDETGKGAQPTVAPDTARAIRDHYAAAGIDTVFYRDDAGTLPFEGTFDPKQPDTIFVSSNPGRAVAQVAGHEFTHALADTTLPDGTSLGDLLNRQIAASLTPEGQRYAEATFGATAPQRAAFQGGPEGDAAHAAAVQAHLVNELGADIGAEAPRFQSFLPRVVDAVQQRFGNTVAANVLSKLIGGLRAAADTVRGLFGDTATESQNWVANIGEIHDTLARLYAERFGSPVEREQAVIGAMRDRAARNALVAGPQTALEGVSEVVPPEAAPGSPEAAQAHDALTATALTQRRWLGELADERDQAAAATLQATLLRQTEAAILRPVGGDAAALAPPQAARLADVRARLDAAVRAAGDTPQMAVVRNEIGATQEAMAAQTKAAPAAAPRAALAPEALQSGLESIDPRVARVDATRFQFKSNADERGVTDRLQGVNTWQERLAGISMVWRDADGQDWVADGHQRFGLANRLMDAGHPPIRINAFVLDAADGITEGMARAIAAAKNIAEGTGTAIDAAKVFREAARSGTELPEMPPRSVLVRDGQALARLGDDAFGMAVNDVVPTSQAALVGRLVDDPAEQAEAMRVLAKAKPENLRQAETMIRDMLASGTERATQGGMFGEEHFASSVVLERAKILDEAARQLSRDKATFGMLVAESDRIEGHGANALDAKANRERLSADEQASQLITGLATRRGPVSDALTGIARRFKSGDLQRAAAAREFVGVVRDAMAGRLDAGADAGGAVAGEAGSARGVAFSPRRLPLPPQAGTDLLGREAPEAQPRAEREPTIRNDRRQVDMFGTADAAVQAQAARDQAGRGALLPRGEQKPADEGLFERKEPKGPTLFSPRPVSRLTGEEVAPAAASLPELRRAAIDYYNRELKGGAPAHTAIGDVGFEAKGIRHVITNSADPFKLRALPAVRGILEHGEYLGREAPSHPRKDTIVAFHRFAGPVDIGGDSRRATVLVYERADGSKFYDLNAKRDDAPPTTIQGLSAAPLKTPLVPRDVSSDQGGRTLTQPATTEPLAGEVGGAQDSVNLDLSKNKGRTLFSPRREEDRAPLYSALQRGVDRLGLDKAPPGQWLSTIRNMPGVKAEEVRWSGVEDWLKQQPKSVTRADVLDYLRANALDVREVVRGAPTEPPDVAAKRQRFQDLNDAADRVEPKGGELSPAEYDEMRQLGDELSHHPNPWLSAKEPMYERHALPGGENYRELLVTLPKEQFEKPISGDPFAQVPFAHEYRSSHWEERNVLAHVRFDERTAPDGAKTLLVHEVQSDWHQAGRRRGYQGDFTTLPAGWTVVEFPTGSPEQRFMARSPDGHDITSYGYPTREAAIAEALDRLNNGAFSTVPNAPFKTTWPALVMKRIIKFAVDNGFDRVAWAPGDVQADRYDLSKHIDHLVWDEKPSGRGTLVAYDKNGHAVISRPNVRPEELPDVIGKEAADKLMQRPLTKAGQRQLSNADLKVGGEGMRAFYDKMLPAEVNKIAGRFGGKVGMATIPKVEKTDFAGAEWRGEASGMRMRAVDAALAARRGRDVLDPLFAAASDIHKSGADVESIREGLARTPAGPYVEKAGGWPELPIKTQPVHSLDITPNMRRAVQSEGLPLFSPRLPHERPGASAAEVEEAPQLGRHEDDVSALINAVVTERGGIAGTASAPTVEDRDLSRVAQLGSKAVKNLNPLERSQSIFPRTLAALDDKFASYYRAFIARQTEGNTNAHDLRSIISDSLVRLPATSRDRVYAALELARKWNARPTNPELRVRVRNNSYWQAQHSKIGDDYILTAEETHAFHDALRLGDAGWDTFTAALVKREGWRGEADPAAIEAAAAKAGLHLPEGKRLMRLATALRTAQQQANQAYFPAMRFGDIYLAVTPKLGPDLDNVSVRLGRPQVQWFQTVERAPGRDLLGLRRTPPDQMQEVRDAIAALGKRNDNTGQPAFGAFKNTSPGVWESATHRIETGDLRRTPEALRQLNIPAIEKLFMLMERHATAKVIQDVLAERTPEEGMSAKDAAELKRQTARYGDNFKLTGGEAFDRYQALLGSTKDTLLDALYHDLLAGWKKRASLTPGYSADFDRAIGTHIGQVSRNAADMVHREPIDAAYQDIQDNHPNQSVRLYAQDFQRDQDNPRSMLSRAAQSANQIGFVYALAVNPASTLKIMLHAPMMAAPVMSVGVGMGRAAKELALATGEAYRNVTFDAQHGASIDVAALGKTPGEKAFIAELDKAGLLHSVGADDVRGINDRQAGLWGPAATLIRRAMDIASSNISVADQANRTGVALAAYRIAQNKSALMLAAKPLMQRNALFRAEVAKATEENMRGSIGTNQDMATAEAAALQEVYPRFMLDQAAGQWGRANQAPAMRGTEGHLLFALHGFQTRYLSTMLSLLKNSGPEGKVAAAWMIGGLAAVAGAYGQPFVQDVENGADWAWKAVSHVDPMIDAHLREWMADAGLGKVGADILLRGPASALFGTDMPSAVGFGDIVSRSMAPTDALGTVPSMLLGRLMAAYNRESTGQGAAIAGAELLPAALRNPAQAALQARQGVISARGEMEQPAGDITAADTAKRASGFTSLDAAQARARNEFDYDVAHHDDELRQDIVRSVAVLAVRASAADRSGDHAGADALRAQAQRIIQANQGLRITEQAYKDAEFETMNPALYRLTRTPMRVRAQVQASPYP